MWKISLGPNSKKKNRVIICTLGVADDGSGNYFLLRIHQHLNNFQRSSSCMYLNTFQSKAIGMQYPRHTINQQDLYNDISSFLFFLPYFFHFGMFNSAPLHCLTIR